MQKIRVESFEKLEITNGDVKEEDDFVEQAYLVGAVADRQALAAGDARLKALSIRARRCSSSRFELAPELWQVLSEDLGWKNVEHVGAKGGREG